MTTQSPAQSPDAPTSWLKVSAVVGGLLALLTVLLSAFALPALNSEPNEIPIAVAGPEPAVAQIETQLSRQDPDAFDVTTAADADEATALIEDREVYGAVVADQAGVSVLTAGAASPAIATMLNQMAAEMSKAQGAEVSVEDVVPLTEDDPKGSGLAAGALPLAMAGMLIPILLSSAVRGVGRRVVGTLVAGAAGGAVVAAILQYWFGSITGDYWVNAAALALGVSATAWALLGLRAVLGQAGIGLGAAVIMLLGNPLSGLTSAPEMLPAGWGAFGQMLPPGATGTLLRSTAFFDGAAAQQPILVLSAWVAAGVLLFAIGETIAAVRRRRAAASEAETPAASSEPAEAAG
ncbi:MAG: hypothetical protein ACRDXX_00875 [Stackebrandtia sp.]